MKNNHAIEQFQKDLMILLEKHYRKSLSERIKRALRNKEKMSV
jgi:hypothetical protein